ncbi:MAG: diaminopimelate epimerase [Firmicutes bacterium]|nr:diaminopimelate epimerase [Bacillota bacterium]
MHFVKMHGCGNDYIFVDCFREGEDHDWPRLAKEISDRHWGIGSDGLILVMPPHSGDADFRMRMFNSDGSEGEMCGNGIRCFARYVFEHGLTRKTHLEVETLAGMIRPDLILRDGSVTAVRVDMGVPSLRREDIPMQGEPGSSALGETLLVKGKPYTFGAVSMGNPHCVIFVEDVAGVPLAEIGPVIENLPMFPRRTNVEFVQVLGRELLRMRVWERGAGITMACGTGACASAVASHKMGFTGNHTQVVADGGTLEVEWAGNGRVYLTGPAEKICTGVFTRWKEDQKS